MDYECEGLHAIDSLLSYSHLQTLVPLPATRGIAEMLLCSFQARVDRAYAILDELESQKRRESSEEAGDSSEDMEISDREEADEYADIKSAIRDVHLAAPWPRVLWLVNLIDTMGQIDGADSTNGVVRAGVGTDATVDVEDESSTDLDEKDSHWPNIAKKLYNEIVSTRNANRTIETVSEEEEQQAAPSLSDIVSFLRTVPHATSLQSAIEELWRILLTFKLGKLTVFVTPLDKDKFDDRILERPVDWYEKSIAQRNAVLAAATGDDDLAVISLTTAAESASPTGTRLASTRFATARQQSKAKNYVEIDDESDAIPRKKSSDAIHVTDDTYEESPFVVQTARRTRSAAAKLSQPAKKSFSASSSAISLVDNSDVVSVNVVKPASFYSSSDSSKHRGSSDKQDPVVTYKSSTTSKQTRKNVKENDWLRSVDVPGGNGATQLFHVAASLREGSRLPAFKKFNSQEQLSYPTQQQQQQSHQHHNTQSQNEYIYAANRQQSHYKTHQTYPHQQDNNQHHHQYYSEHQQYPYYQQHQPQQLDLYRYSQDDGPPPLSDLPPPPPPPRVPHERESPRSIPATNAIYEQQVQANMYYNQEQQRNHPAPTNYAALYQSAPPLPVPSMPQYLEEYVQNNTRALYDVGVSQGSSTPSSSQRNHIPSADLTTTSTPAPPSFKRTVSDMAKSVSDSIGNAIRTLKSAVGQTPNTGTDINLSRNTEIEVPRKRYSKPRETTPCSKLYESNAVVEDRGFIGVGVGGKFRQHEGSQRSEKRSNAAAGGWGNEGGVTLFCDDDERDEELEMEKARRKRNRSGGYRRDFDNEERDEGERAMCMECNRVEPMVGTNLCQDCQVGHLNGTGGHIVQDIAFRTSAALTDLLADEVVPERAIRKVGASAITSRIVIPSGPTPPLTYANVAASANSRAASTLAKQAEVICID
ncbi:hypothetical protein HDU80_009873 [Chytriomyces hyalinus]|nr:hypothetical protein HDU80_009873 [Chytriomyces hyalinus]